MVLPSSPILSVRRCQPQLVVPAKATPRELKELSDIDDQDGFRFQIPVLMFYQSHPSMKGKDPAKVIREALAKALVYYYPLAGRLVEGPNRKLIVDCTGELGVLFIEADADITLQQLGDTVQPPCPYLEELLYDVPGSGGILGCPLLLLQVTRLLCGGFVLALRLNHTMADAAGLVQFLNAVAEMAQGRNSAPSVHPVWRREILNARNPPRVTRIHNEYNEVTVSKGTTTKCLDEVEDGHMVQRSLFFSPKDMVAIRKHLPPNLRNCSTFELISACLWRCRTRALELAPHEVVRFSGLVNVNNSKNKFHLPYGYYGNAFCFPASVSKAEALCKNSLQYAVELVKRAKAAATGSNGEEYIRSVADLMVIKGRPMYITSWNFLISDNTRAGFGEVDFGWGKPLYGGPAGAMPLLSFLTRFKNGIAVAICLPFPVMERFQRELSKMTQQPVEDPYNIKIIPRL